IESKRILPCLPDKEAFFPDSMDDEELKEFSKWYNEQPHDAPYDLLEKMEIYCRDDVRVLMEGVMAFRKAWMEVYGLDPFSRNSTLPSAVIEAFRSTCLKQD